MRVLFATEPDPRRGWQLARFLGSEPATRFSPVVLTRHPGPDLAWAARTPVETCLCPDWDDVALLARILEERRVELVQTDGYGLQLARAAFLAGIPHLFRLGVPLESAGKEALLVALANLGRAVVCPCEFVAEPLRRAGAPVRIIANGVAPGKRGNPFRGAPVFAMLAHFWPSKRHADFIRAAAAVRTRHPQARFVISGRPDPSRSEFRRVESLARGVVDLTESPVDLSLVDAVVLPSENEGCSLALLEAMAAGLPVLASNAGGNPELVEPEQLFELGDVPALAEAMLRLAHDPERARALGQAGRLRVERSHNLADRMEDYARLYESLRV